eukprot:6192147-Pleurochrysis_carterae.AAC.5
MSASCNSTASGDGISVQIASSERVAISLVTESVGIGIFPTNGFLPLIVAIPTLSEGVVLANRLF